MNHATRIRLPECWKRLVQMDFPDDLEGILGEKTDHAGIADPKPHYDDCRTVEGKFDNGMRFSLYLVSGQHNYFGELYVGEEDPLRCNADILESLSSPLEVEMPDGDTYTINIDWVPDAEWNLNLSAGKA